MSDKHPSPNSKLARVVQYFTEESRSLACMSTVCGTRDTVFSAYGGIKSLETSPITADSIFDLASLSKLFTGLTALRLRAAGQLDLNAPVIKYAPQFVYLDGVTVNQILCFEVALHTPERIDMQPSQKAAEATLFNCKPHPNTARAYSDIHAMVARYVLEGAAEEPLMQLVDRELLKPLGMSNTWCHVPEQALSRCVSYDREHRIEGKHWFVREGIATGTVHDPKAQRIAPNGEVFCGHAGLFSTAGDITKLCQGILRGDVLDATDLREMALNRTGHLLPDGSWTQHLGLQCYVRHPVQRYSEVPVYMSNEAIALSGFVGNHIAIDPLNGIFEFFLGNRVLNRLTVLTPPLGLTRTDYGIALDGTGCIKWPGEGNVISSVDFAYFKDNLYHLILADVLGLS